MTITAEAPRGGVVEYIGSTSYAFVLRNREIERFEDKHRGIFDLWDGFFLAVALSQPAPRSKTFWRLGWSAEA